jgi:hypothetical protein
MFANAIRTLIFALGTSYQALLITLIVAVRYLSISE